MTAKRPSAGSEYDSGSTTALLSKFGTQIDQLLKGQDAINAKLDTQFQTKDQAAADKADFNDKLDRLKENQDSGFKALADRESERSRRRDLWTNALLTIGGGVAIALFLAFLKIAGAGL